VIGTGAWSSADTVIWTNTTQYISSYNYSCPSGGTLSGTTCNIAQSSYSATVNYYSGYYCVSPWGPPTGNSQCQRTISSTQLNCTNNGGTWHSNNSTCTLFSSANYGPDGGVFGSYDTCPSGGTLTGSICITVYASSYAATATPVYSWYYAYRG
jgi:conjugal transfer mating pair stabilization protein TraN